MKNKTDPIYNAGILVVDDTHDNLRLLSKLLIENGYYVRPVSDGKRALSAIQNQLPDLILLDIMMPGMDGYEVCRHLQADERTRNIPIIFISALNEIIDKVKAFSIGGRDYISKPFQEEEVLARIKTHLTIRKLQKRLEEQNEKLQKSLDEIKTLQGIIPICASCKMIRDDEGFWKQVEVYITEHSDAQFSHGICPGCAKKLYPDLNLNLA